MPKRTPPEDEKTQRLERTQRLTERTQKLPERTPETRSRGRGKVVGSVHTPKKRHNRPRRDPNPILRRVCGVLFLIELGLIVFANPYLRVTQVRVEGTQTLAPSQVFEEARVPARTNIFWMALRQPFIARLNTDPVVDHATRRIKLPNTLILRVWERQPFATLALDHQYWLLDSRGVPFRTLTEPYPGVPLVAAQSDDIQGQMLSADTLTLGKPIGAVWLQQTYKLIALVAPDQNLAAAKIKVDQNGNLCLNRRDNLQILLGQADALPQKVALAQAAVAADGGAIARQASYIDVSCPQQPVWMPRPASKSDRRINTWADSSD